MSEEIVWRIYFAAVSKYFFLKEQYMGKSNHCLFLVFIIIITHLFLAASGLSCGTKSLCCSKQDLSIRCAGFFLVVAGEGSVLVACGLSCPGPFGILVPLPGIKPASLVLKGRFF